MTSPDKTQIRKLHLSLGDGPLIWEGRFDPPLDSDPTSGELCFGTSVAQVRLFVRVLYKSATGTKHLSSLLDTRSLAQLWHTVKAEPGAKIPVKFLPMKEDAKPRSVTIDTEIDRAELAKLLEQTEESAGLGPRTQTISPPIYLQAFWGPREYGHLDEMIGRLKHFNVVPDGLREKARQVDAPNNWAIVCPEDLPDKQAVLEALQPLIARRAGNVFELAHGHDPIVVDEFCASLTKLPLDERPYYLLALGDLDVLSMEYQYFLQSFAAAGRLALNSPEEYAAYAEKIIGYETTQAGFWKG